MSNDGQFGSLAVEYICPSDGGCQINADIYVTHATTFDGSIEIIAYSGIGPYEYSIDGGASFWGANTFNNLPPGDYDIIVMGGDGNCFYEETVTIEICTFTSVDIDNTRPVVVADGASFSHQVRCSSIYV